jgi:membrane protease YdiL (CAAX protease family)
MAKINRLTRYRTILQDIILVVIGYIALLAIQNFAMDPNLAASIFILGVSAVLFGTAEMLMSLHLIQKLQSLKRNTKGNVWVWAVCLAGLCLYAITFYVLVMPTLQIIGIVEGMTSWDPQAAATLNLTRVVLNWHPIFFICGLLLWAFVNSVRREDVTYPAY